MSGDIEEFLRQAAQRRKNADRQQAPEPPPRQQQAQPQPSRPLGKEMPSDARSKQIEIIEIPDHAILPDPSIEADQAFSDPYRKKKDSVHGETPKSRLLSSEVSSDDIASHAERLGSKLISHRDDASQLVNDHLGESVPDRAFEQEKESKFTNELVKMLNSPTSVAQALIMKEILDRPNFDDF